MPFNFEGDLTVGGKKLSDSEKKDVQETLNKKGGSAFNFGDNVEVGGKIHKGNKTVHQSETEPTLEDEGVNVQVESGYETVEESELPDGAILDDDLIADGTIDVEDEQYKLWKPDVKCNGKFIYIPIA
ncbi:MAG: hypothetical protein HOA24_00865 [Candidatus Pacebacteria bacterium]|jgi:hypothetical protein|nr:hypothetical protein [Candidatus Paceibacterota bacterium]MBT3511735.1 hypothetical protein [Candidatus Paceibacterota bacterium]MBT4005164.1 hypothetical protein [Candidatus Paceibacterota bacterium]MBT4358621.1 hypothetical protein [Candidatus Paceibacterota bacterium]MBT6898539.1 hypothetical protein [Candidatus Paceibacterota bacterium]